MNNSTVAGHPEYLVVSTSLNPVSRSRRLAEGLLTAYRSAGVPHRHLDLRDHPLPLCDGHKAYDAPGVAETAAMIRAARVIILATPVYNFDANAAAKNLLELTGKCWENKVVGFLCAAGGKSSYMSVMSLANSLMLDFRCVIIPRFVYATGEDFAEDDRLVPEIQERINQLARESMALRFDC